MKLSHQILSCLVSTAIASRTLYSVISVPVSAKFELSGQWNSTVPTITIPARLSSATEAAEVSQGSGDDGPVEFDPLVDNAASPCYQSWKSWIDDAVRAGKSTGTVTSTSIQTLPPTARDWKIEVSLCNKYRKCGNDIRVEVASVRTVPFPFTKTVSYKAEPTLASLLKSPPNCSLKEDECFNAWTAVASRKIFQQAPIWEIANDLGPYMKRLGKNLFGCPVPDGKLDICSSLFRDLAGIYNLVPDPSGVCTNNAPPLKLDVDRSGK
jgi:hypothetical protein